jgi:hypothetical protein
MSSATACFKYALNQTRKVRTRDETPLRVVIFSNLRSSCARRFANTLHARKYSNSSRFRTLPLMAPLRDEKNSFFFDRDFAVRRQRWKVRAMSRAEKCRPQAARMVRACARVATIWRQNRA